MEKIKLSEKKFILNQEISMCTGNFLKLIKKQYTLEGSENIKIEWECIQRPNVENFKRIYGVEVIAFFKEGEKTLQETNKDDLQILLIENYRYPIEKKVLEFPAGLIDEDEYGELRSIHEKILNCNDNSEKFKLIQEADEELKKIIIQVGERELKEETGYKGTFKSFFAQPNANVAKIFENVFHDPWKGLENSGACIFEIDNNLEENKNPFQSLETCEIIKTHKVKISDLLTFITEKIEKENYGCTQQLYSFALGYYFKKIIKIE